jgi:hypothetical protein
MLTADAVGITRVIRKPAALWRLADSRFRRLPSGAKANSPDRDLCRGASSR